MMAAAILVLALSTAPAAAPPDSSGAPPPPADSAAPPDTSIRVPGTVLRFGWTRERAGVLGALQEVRSAGATTVRRGDVRWFGATAHATLTFVDNSLGAVRLECTSASPAMVSYAGDELRREGYRRISHDFANGNETSGWTGPAEAAVTASGTSLVAEFSRAGSSVATENSTEEVGSTVQLGRVAAALVAREAAATASAPAANRPAANTAGANPAVAPAGSAAAAADTRDPGPLPGEIDFTVPRADSLPAPRVVSSPPPAVRPQIAVDAGLFGRVQVRARVDTTGRVVYAQVSRGIAEFNSAALAWASAVRFEPYHAHGQVAPVVVIIPVVFTNTDSTSREGRP